MKELTSGVVDDDYDDDQGSAMIFAPAAVRSTCCCCMCGDNLRVRSLCKRLAHIATANFLPARHRREGKGREGKRREVGKGREGRDFPVCRQSTTLSADSRGAHGRRHLCCRLMHVHPSVFPLLHPPFQLLLPR
jgi:hypothetical protein